MKRYILLVFFFTITALLFSQENNREEVYKDGSIYLVKLDSNDKELEKNIVGKEATIIYDKVFKSYRIYFKSEDGKGSDMILSNIKISDNGMIRVKDNFNNIFYVSDWLSKTGMLMLIHNMTTDGYAFMTIIEDAKLKK